MARDVHRRRHELFAEPVMDRAARPSLLFVNQHYTPDVAATGQCLADLAEHLALSGFDVEVLASRTRYGDGSVVAPGREVLQGVKVHRVTTTRFGRRTYVGRLVDYATFYVVVLAKLLVGRRYDGVVFLTTPPLVSVAGRIARLLRGQPYAVWSMDLHPEAEIAAGMLRERSLLARLLAWLDASAYRNADFVVDLGPHMRQRIARKGVSEARMRTVNIWGGRGDVAPWRGANPLTQRLGLEDRFIVMYSGNAGIVHDFGAILEAMRELRDDPRIFFLFVGGGPRRREVEEFADREQLPNFEYHDYIPRELLRYSLAVAHVHLISLRQTFVGVSVPSKLYGAMASARPILYVGPKVCETADAIREARCGVVIDPKDAGDVAAGKRIASVLRAWAEVPSACEELGARGRCAFLERYEHRLSCASFEGIVRSSWGRESPRVGDVPFGRPRRAREGTEVRARASDPPAARID
jgi:colanic acid biosynthesis glycosyl transferase WcaI